MNIVKNLVPKSKYSIKCPYEMQPTRIVVHNTANDASAQNEIAYMIRNNNETSYHYAVDDKEAVQGIPENRNAWHASDGNGKGNREGIGIEICYSLSGGSKFIKAEQNAAKLIAQILKRYGWGIDKVTKHQDYTNKYCPHRTLDMGWERFLNMIKNEMQPPKTYVNVNVERLLKGSKGQAVLSLQMLLVAKGYGNFKPDASFGVLTEKAVRDFQADNGTGVDGVVGVKTWNKLLGN